MKKFLIDTACFFTAAALVGAFCFTLVYGMVKLGRWIPWE